MQYTRLFFNVGLFGAVLFLSTACKPQGPDGGPSGGMGGPPPFSEFDLNGDGVMTLEEFSEHEIPHGEHAEVFSMIDANGDGQITEEEFTSHKPPAPPSQ